MNCVALLLELCCFCCSDKEKHLQCGENVGKASSSAISHSFAAFKLCKSASTSVYGTPLSSLHDSAVNSCSYCNSLLNFFGSSPCWKGWKSGNCLFCSFTVSVIIRFKPEDHTRIEFPYLTTSSCIHFHFFWVLHEAASFGYKILKRDHWGIAKLKTTEELSENGHEHSHQASWGKNFSYSSVSSSVRD